MLRYVGGVVWASKRHSLIVTLVRGMGDGRAKWSSSPRRWTACQTSSSLMPVGNTGGVSSSVPPPPQRTEWWQRDTHSQERAGRWLTSVVHCPQRDGQSRPRALSSPAPPHPRYAPRVSPIRERGQGSVAIGGGGIHIGSDLGGGQGVMLERPAHQMPRHEALHQRQLRASTKLRHPQTNTGVTKEKMEEKLC